MIEYGNIGKVLWDFVMNLLATVGDIWAWANKVIKIGSVEFTPLMIGGSVIVLLIVMALVKLFVPFL